MSNYLRDHSTRKTPQSEPIPGSSQVANNAGGFAWEVDIWTRLRRFLILGAEGGSYYVGQREMVKGNVAALDACLAEDGERTVELIAEVSDRGLARDNDTALFCLAMACSFKDEGTRRAAFKALPRVARTGTHILHFVAFMEQFRGWGPAARHGVAAWYTGRPAEKLAYQLIKYRQRDGWSHRDILRLAHPKAPSIAHAELFEFVTGNATKKPVPIGDLDAPSHVLRVIEGFRMAQVAESPRNSANLIRDYKLPREAIRSEHLTDPVVQEALLEDMPMTALIRNLGNMTRSGLLDPFGEATQKVIAQLGDSERIRRARVHPLTVLSALMTYKSGHGDRGGNTWSPVAQIVDALNAAFYSAFENIEPTGKRFLLAVDVSNSMRHAGGRYGLGGLLPLEAAAVMAMVTARSESRYETVAFAGSEIPGGIKHSLGVGQGHGNFSGYRDERGFTPMAVTPSMRLNDVAAEFDRLSHVGMTDCALPMIYAMQEEREVDAFCVYTDNETWAGDIHPMQALREYREKSGIDAKLIVCGMTATDFSIADPNDSGSMDVVGFDTSAPAAMSAFIRGEV
jgi:60 kDa SS-A/Ro ribonucleoprotein